MTTKSFKSKGNQGNIAVGIILFVAAILIAIWISGGKNEADIYQSDECGGLYPGSRTVYPTIANRL